MFRKLDDRVKLWATLNEPWVVTDGGYLHGALAPGPSQPLRGADRHAQPAARAWRRGQGLSRDRASTSIGIVVNLEPKYPASDDPADRAATARADAYMNRQYLDPVLLGRYPDELQEIFGEAWPEWPAEDFDARSRSRSTSSASTTTRAASRASTRSAWPLRAAPVRQKQATYTETGWEVFPQGLTDTLVWVKERYGNPPLYVTENGAAFFDPPVADERPRRRSAARRLPAQACRAPFTRRSRPGVDLRGYFAWSLLDNFEWSLGYSKRFGIVHVNFETQERTLKDSARLYAKIIETRGRILNEPLPAPDPF